MSGFSSGDTVFQTGERYPGKLPTQEGTEFTYVDGQVFLKLFLKGVTRAECEELQGRAKLALTVRGPIMYVLFKFGDMAWSDAPFSWHLIPHENRVPFEDIKPGQRLLLPVILTDLDTGRIVAMRGLLVPASFVNPLAGAIREQAGQDFDEQAYDQQLAQDMVRFTSDELVEQAQTFWAQSVMK